MSLQHGYINDFQHEQMCPYHQERLRRDEPAHAVYLCRHCKSPACYCSGGGDSAVCDHCDGELRRLGWSPERISETYPP